MALVKKGAKKVGYLQRSGAVPTVMGRLRGVALAALETGLLWWKKRNVLRCEPENRRTVSRFVSAERPDDIVSGNDIAAARQKESLLAIKKGGEVRLSGFDDVAVAFRNGLRDNARMVPRL